METGKLDLLTLFELMLFCVLFTTVNTDNYRVQKTGKRLNMLDILSEMKVVSVDRKQTGTLKRKLFRASKSTHKRQDEGALRLVDGPSELEGRLEVFHEGQWGTICDDGFNMDDARVACRQLGYSGGSYIRYYTPGKGNIWLSNLVCDGTESRLDDCRFDGWGEHSCRHWQDVAVSCEQSEDDEALCDEMEVQNCFDLLNMVSHRNSAIDLHRCRTSYKWFIDCLEDEVQLSCFDGPIGSQIFEQYNTIVNLC
ncbi:galectin-3-binding protein B-like [Argopecten irradians]|uniref:galectin-3-binding protein B-like n=1 Tax=Argopecten irradians TaxID=31199 RepID=UPI00371B91F3